MRLAESGILSLSRLSLLSFQVGKDRTSGHPIFTEIPLRYELLVSRNLSAEANYGTVAHELAHLYCGHLGTPNKKWWPNRHGLSKVCREFEAESVAHLLCSRLNISIPADEYLSSHMEKDMEVPPISLECVMKSAGLIESMGRGHLKKRKSSD